MKDIFLVAFLLLLLFGIISVPIFFLNKVRNLEKEYLKYETISKDYSFNLIRNRNQKICDKKKIEERENFSIRGISMNNDFYGKGEINFNQTGKGIFILGFGSGQIQGNGEGSLEMGENSLYYFYKEIEAGKFILEKVPTKDIVIVEKDIGINDSYISYIYNWKMNGSICEKKLIGTEIIVPKGTLTVNINL